MLVDDAGSRPRATVAVDQFSSIRGETMTANPEDDLIALTGKIVAAYASGNTLPAQDLPNLIRAVHGVFLRLATGGGAGSSAPSEESAPVPAVPIKKSVFPDYIVCLEDGKKLKMLRRHLQNAYNMTPEQYRQRWNLPQTYPMTAPNYAARRSELAKQNGLGQKPKSTAASGDNAISAKKAAAVQAAIGSTKATVIKARAHDKKKPASPTET